MKVYHLRTEQFVPAQLDEVFAFFAQPENLSRLTPGSLGFEVLTPTPIKMRAGALIDYAVRPLGFRQFWTTLISEFEPGRMFADVQLRGPYRFWHHTHEFETVPGGTRITDTVRYVLPFGWLGRLAHGLFVRRQLDGIFAYRRRVIEEIFRAA